MPSPSHRNSHIHTSNHPEETHPTPIRAPRIKNPPVRSMQNRVPTSKYSISQFSTNCPRRWKGRVWRTDKQGKKKKKRWVIRYPMFISDGHIRTSNKQLCRIGCGEHMHTPKRFAAGEMTELTNFLNFLCTLERLEWMIEKAEYQKEQVLPLYTSRKE